MIHNAGEIAALLTAVCFSFSSIFFTQAGKKFGPMVVNRIRLVLAVILLSVAHWIIYGNPVPLHAGSERWFWLGISGVVGLAIGDLFLFQAFISLGTRLAMLFLSLSPALATLLAWLFLGETLGTLAIIGILMTLAGIAWVVMESNRNGKTAVSNEENHRRKNFSRGILAGVLAAAGQASGLVLAKNGMLGGFPALSGNVIRMSAAFIVIWIVTIVQGQVASTAKQAFGKKSGLLYILGGSIFGPLAGVSLSLFAIQNTDVGIASTLIALPPVFLLPVGHFIFKEHITWQAVGGTVIAIAGVAILFII